MSSPNKFSPPAKPPGGGSSLVIAIVLLAAGMLSTLCCAGFGAGLFVYSHRSGKSIAQVAKSIQQQIPTPPVVTPGWAEDWMVMEMLARAYTKSLDAVAADKRVIERLGEPIEPISDSDKLFRRERKGSLSNEDESFEFDISGPKGKAVVHVISQVARGVPPVSVYSPEGFQPLKITVKFSDDSSIEVPPLKEGTEPQP